MCDASIEGYIQSWLSRVYFPGVKVYLNRLMYTVDPNLVKVDPNSAKSDPNCRCENAIVVAKKESLNGFCDGRLIVHNQNRMFIFKRHLMSPIFNQCGKLFFHTVS